MYAKPAFGLYSCYQLYVYRYFPNRGRWQIYWKFLLKTTSAIKDKKVLSASGAGDHANKRGTKTFMQLDMCILDFVIN